jgi:hypothetical protein
VPAEPRLPFQELGCDGVGSLFIELRQGYRERQIRRPEADTDEVIDRWL